MLKVYMAKLAVLISIPPKRTTQAGSSRRFRQEDTIFACELFECYGYEGSNTTDNEDLELLVVVFA